MWTHWGEGAPSERYKEKFESCRLGKKSNLLVWSFHATLDYNTDFSAISPSTAGKKNSCLTLTVLCYRRDWMISPLQVLQLRITSKLLKKENRNKATHPFEGPVFFKVGRRQELIEKSHPSALLAFCNLYETPKTRKTHCDFFPRSYRWSEPSGNRTKMEESRCFTRLQN